MGKGENMAEVLSGPYYQDADEAHSFHLKDVVKEQGLRGGEGYPIDWAEMYDHLSQAHRLTPDDLRRIGGLMVSQPNQAEGLPHAA
jgi:hypothetical protein